MRKILLQCLLLLILHTAKVVNAQTSLDLTTLSFNSDNVSLAEDDMQITKTDTGYRCTWHLRNVTVTDDQYSNGKIIEIFGYTQLPGVGTPMLPVTSIPFNLGYDDVMECEILSSRYVEVPLELAPSRMPLLMLNECGYTKENIIPISNELSNIDLVSINDYKIYRGDKVGYVMLAPVQYDIQDKKVRIYTDITFDIHVNMIDMVSSYALEDINMSNPNFDQNILSFDFSRSADRNPVDCSEDLLIITVPKYESIANEYGKWKGRTGYKVHVESASNWTILSVKSYIDSFLLSHPKFSTLLIIGNLNDVPSFESNVLNENRPDVNDYKGSNHYTDLYYACFDGENDRQPDILYGRIPANSTEEVINALNKIKDYDESPSMDANYYQTAMGCGSFIMASDKGVETSSMTYTLENIGQLLEEKGYNWSRQYYAISAYNPLKWYNGKDIPEELKRPNFSWNANYETEAQEINDGTFVCLYNIHGSKSGYMHPHMLQRYIPLLNNKANYPVFFSMGCSTGKDYTDNFAHALLSKKESGAVAVFANTEIGLQSYTDHMIYGMFNAIWPSRRISGMMETLLPNTTQFLRLGQIMELGNREMEAYNKSPYKYFDLHCREVMQCFGDPSMMLRTRKPIPFKGVNIVSSLSSIEVHLNDYMEGDMVTYVFPDGDIKSYCAAHSSVSNAGLGMEIWLSGKNRPLTLCRDANNNNLLPDRGSNILACYVSSSFSKVCNVKFNIDVVPSKAELRIISQTGELKISQSCASAVLGDNGVYSQTINLGNITGGTYIVALVIDGNVVHSMQLLV